MKDTLYGVEIDVNERMLDEEAMRDFLIHRFDDELDEDPFGDEETRWEEEDHEWWLATGYRDLKVVEL